MEYIHLLSIQRYTYIPFNIPTFFPYPHLEYLSLYSHARRVLKTSKALGT